MGSAGRGGHRRRSGVAWTLALALTLTACGSDEPETASFVGDVPETVALGEFPEPPTADSSDTIPPPVPIETTTTTTEVPFEPISGPIAELVEGNRVLVIGDTVFQATSPRAGGELCPALEAFGWQAEVAAEVGRFVEFGREVVRARVIPEEPEWDAAMVMLGNHFDGDVAAYRAEINELVEALAPRPVLVYTLVEDDTYQAELNDIIRELPTVHANVAIVDLAVKAAEEPEIMLADVPSGLSEEGLRRVGLFGVAALGESTVRNDAGCLPPIFTDDSAIVL